MPMTTLFAQVDSAALMSVYKPIVFFLVLLGWAWVVGWLDKDAEYFHLARQLFNGGHFAGAVAGFGLWLLIPWFWFGSFVAIILVSVPIGVYIYMRNEEVPEEARWRLSAEMLTQRLDTYQQESAQKTAAVKLIDASGAPAPVPAGDDPRVPAHRALEQLLDFALPRHAEKIEMLVSPQQASFQVIIDGVRFPRGQDLEPKVAAMALRYLKEQAGMDGDEVRKRQTGRITVEHDEGGGHGLALATWGSTKAIHLVIEVDPDKKSHTPFDALGFTPGQREKLEKSLDEHLGGTGGVCLVAAPPGEGMTTTLYSLVERHDPYLQSVVTLEKEIEGEIEGVRHQLMYPEEDQARALPDRLKAMLRREIAVLMLAQLEDNDTAKAVADFASETRFYLGVQKPDTFEAVRAWCGAVGELGAASEALVAVLAQRLVRKLCPNCKIAYTPDPNALRKMNLPPERVEKLYKQSGKIRVGDKEQICPQCLGIGFRGREAVFEVMTLDEEARKLIAGDELENFRSHLRKQQMQYLQEAALEKVIAGQTSIGEIARVFSSQKGQKKEAASPKRAPGEAPRKAAPG